MAGLARGEPARESVDKHTVFLPIPLTHTHTKVMELSRTPERCYPYLRSRQDPLLVIANGYIHHPVIVTLKKSRVLRRLRRKQIFIKNQHKTHHKSGT